MPLYQPSGPPLKREGEPSMLAESTAPLIAVTGFLATSSTLPSLVAMARLQYWIAQLVAHIERGGRLMRHAKPSPNPPGLLLRWHRC